MKLWLIFLVGCGGTRLSLTSQGDLQAAERLTAAIVTRQDGGMPHADRVLASGAFCLVNHVLVQGKSPTVDAGIPCR